MEQTFDITLKNRESLQRFLETYSLERLNRTPPPFNNNLIWNLTHTVVTQQMLVYGRSGLPMMVSDELIARFRGGTKPEADVTQPEIDAIQSLLFTTIEKMRTDYAAGIFKNYDAFTTKTGFSIRNVEDAIAFNNYHEGVHMGVMLAIRKFV